MSQEPTHFTHVELVSQIYNVLGTYDSRTIDDITLCCSGAVRLGNAAFEPNERIKDFEFGGGAIANREDDVLTITTPMGEKYYFVYQHCFPVHYGWVQAIPHYGERSAGDKLRSKFSWLGDAVGFIVFYPFLCYWTLLSNVIWVFATFGPALAVLSFIAFAILSAASYFLPELRK